MTSYQHQSVDFEWSPRRHCGTIYYSTSLAYRPSLYTCIRIESLIAQHVVRTPMRRQCTVMTLPGAPEVVAICPRAIKRGGFKCDLRQYWHWRWACLCDHWLLRDDTRGAKAVSWGRQSGRKRYKSRRFSGGTAQQKNGGVAEWVRRECVLYTHWMQYGCKLMDKISSPVQKWRNPIDKMKLHPPTATSDASNSFLAGKVLIEPENGGEGWRNLDSVLRHCPYQVTQHSMRRR